VHDTDTQSSPACGVSMEAKVRFLSGADAYPDRPSGVDVIETHMSWVFLTDHSVFKLKKPVTSEYFDFTSLAAREVNCRNEVRLNRPLADGVYERVARLTLGADGRLALDGEGETVDWLVVMQRLPADRMLHALIERGSFDAGQLAQLGDHLADFYAGQPPAEITLDAYLARFTREQTNNRAVLSAVFEDRLPGPYAAPLDRLDAVLAANRSLLEKRVRAGCIVDGHGDLRPEHVCMTEPIVIFDCLEFSDELRQVDPVDELAFLGMECEMLGAPWIGPGLIAHVLARLGEDGSDALVALHTASRAMLRARLTLSHLLDPVPRAPEKWRPLADRYVAIADASLARLGS
jgi:aminoglycoside phosphotransferase family enzyme